MDVTEHSPTKSFIAVHLIACAVLWGSSFMMMKLIGDGLPPFVIASLRAIGACLTLAMAVLMLGGSIVPRGREWLDWAALGTLNGWVPNALVAYAMQHLDSGPGALIQSCGPLMTAVLAHFLLAGEQLTRAKITGIVIGLVGVVLLIGPHALAGGGTTLAVIAMLCVALGYALGNIYARRISNAAPVRLALGQQTASSVFATGVALLTTGTAGYAAAPNYWMPLFVLSVLSTAIPIWIFMRLITYAGPTVAAMTGYLVPVVAVMVGIIVLNEPVLPRQILGGAIVLLGVAITTGMFRPKNGSVA